MNQYSPYNGPAQYHSIYYGPCLFVPRYRCQRIGKVLQEAGLISAAQLEVALHDQIKCFRLRLGEILSLRGWVDPNVVDFFVEQWPELVTQVPRQPLGYYLKAAGFLDDAQIEAILKEQVITGVKFGSLAVLRGWIKPATLDFFLSYLAPQSLSRFVEKRSRLTPKPPIEAKETVLLIDNQTGLPITGNLEVSGRKPAQFIWMC